MQGVIRHLLLFVSFFLKWAKLMVTSVSGKRKAAFVSRAVGWQPVPEHPSSTVNSGKGTCRNCHSCSLPPRMALVFHAGGTFIRVGFVYSQNELKRAVSEAVLALTEGCKGLSELGSIARGWHSGRNLAQPAAFQNSQLAHICKVHLPQANCFCTSLLSSKEAVVEGNSRRWWGG